MRSALATLVEIRGGAARSLGAHMAVREDGLFCGFVSGGCVEAAVAAEALAAIRGRDRTLVLGQGSKFFDIDLPCGGSVARIKAPIGLFPKTRDAKSLALSILADIAACRTAAG